MCFSRSVSYGGVFVMLKGMRESWLLQILADIFMDEMMLLGSRVGFRKQMVDF